MKNLHRHLGLIVVVALTAILGACSNNHSDRDGMSGYGDNGKSARSEGTTVEMNATSFSPREVTIRTGESVTWKNSSKENHTVTADPSRAAKRDDVSIPSGAKPFHSGDIAPGKTWKQTFNTPGTYKYVCLHHEDHGMMGTVTVKPSDGSPSPY